MTRKLSRNRLLSVAIVPFVAALIALIAVAAPAQVLQTQSLPSAANPRPAPAIRLRKKRQRVRPMDLTSPSFLPAVTYDSGGAGIPSLAVGDLRGIGTLDLVVGNQCESSTCSQGAWGVLLANGDGTFQPPAIYNDAGYDLTSVAIGDVNNDGHPDVVEASMCPRQVCSDPDYGFVVVAFGNGDGTFPSGYVAPPEITPPSYGISLALGDLRSNGLLDLVVGLGCFYDACELNNVSVMLNEGGGWLESPGTRYAAGCGYGGPIYSVAIGDLNGDGKPDLATASQCWGGGGAVGVLMGNGDGTFQAQTSYNPGGANPLWVAIGDVNGDGIPDLVVANQCLSSSNCNSGGLAVLLGNGDGSFQPAVTYSSGGQNATSVVIADVNGDGYPDLVVANEGSNSVGVLIGNGDGTFQPAVTFESGGVGAYSVVVADVNGDGKLDVVVANCASSSCGTGDGNVAVLLNNSQYTPIASTTALVSSPNPSSYGQVVTFTASVSAEGGTPTGTVEFFNGNVLLGNATLKSGTALFTAYWLPGGSDSIIAKYQGDGEYLPSASSSLTQTVNAETTTTSLVSSTNPSVFGQSVTFTAQVSSTRFTPTGTVLFFDGSTALGSGTLASGSASISIASLTARTHLITAAYQGSADFGASTSPTLNQVVITAATTTSLAPSVNPVDSHKPVTYLATIASQYGGAATGTVTFQDGGTTVAKVSVTKNQAAYTTTYKSGGAHAITATYSGDANNVGSISAPLTEYVAIYASRTVLTTSGSPSQFGQPVTFTATVTSEHGAIPDGDLVTFYDGKTTLGSVALASGTAEYTTSTLLAGKHTVKAVYDGDAIYEISSATVMQIVDKNTTTTSLSSSLNPSEQRQAVTFTAQVASSGPTPTGKVTFKDGTKGLKVVALSGGVASYTTSKLAVGTHAITAEYLGDPNNDKSTSSVLHQVVE